MATTEQIMAVRSALLAIEDYVIACQNKLVAAGDADNTWLLSRANDLDSMTNRLRRVCKVAAGIEP